MWLLQVGRATQQIKQKMSSLNRGLKRAFSQDGELSQTPHNWVFGILCELLGEDIDEKQSEVKQTVCHLSH